MNAHRGCIGEDLVVEKVRCMDGCSNGCRYCHAKSIAVQFKHRTPDSWRQELPRLDLVTRVCSGSPGCVAFPSMHDITPWNLETCMTAITMLLDAGNEILIQTKAHGECMVQMVETLTTCRDRVHFHISMGSNVPECLWFWEPHAPSLSERWMSLMFAHKAGFRTSVVCDPMLDASMEDLVQRVSPHVTDAIWFGMPSQFQRVLKINGEDEDTLDDAAVLDDYLTDTYARKLYAELKDHPKVKWKDSIKKIVGLDLAIEAGLDI